MDLSPVSIRRRRFVAALLAIAAPASAQAADRATLERDARTALEQLTSTVPAARALAPAAKGVLVFPKIVKAGFGFGAQYGDGVLFREGRVTGFYNNSGASYGLQIGAQQYGYAMFLMNDRAVDALAQNEGFEVGIGPSVVLIDDSMARTLSTHDIKDDVYAFVFGQKGLMGGMGIQGNKITPLKD